jgi:hypothetical protein
MLTDNPNYRVKPPATAGGSDYLNYCKKLPQSTPKIVVFAPHGFRLKVLQFVYDILYHL